MKKIYLLVLSGIFGIALTAQQATNVVQSDKANVKKETVSQNSLAGNSNTHEGAKLEELPGFPVYVNTGNKELDDANYASAKETWIANNRDLYNRYNQSKGGTTNTVTRITKAQFEDLPEARKTYVLDHPELFSIEK